MEAEPYEFPEFSEAQIDGLKYEILSHELWKKADELCAITSTDQDQLDYRAYSEWQRIRQSLTWEPNESTKAYD